MGTQARRTLVRVLHLGLLGGLVGVGCLAATACSSSGSNTPGGDADGGSPAPAVSIAQPQDFDGFCNWPHAPAVAAGDAGDGVHGLGPLIVYWNKPPPHGSTQFPVGTMILKESQDPDPSKRVIFAMEKRESRGAGWNTGGADGWEWFSLQDLGNCVVGSPPLWRGTIPPVGEAYTGTPGGDCNGCHVEAMDNDYVWDTALQLSNF
jgi:hypothetical protein